MNPITNSLPLIWWLIILVVTLGPYKFIYKVVILALFICYYGRKFLIIFYFAIQLLILLITQNSFIYRGLSHSLVYDYLDCKTVIQPSKEPVIYVTNYPVSILDFLLLGVFPKDTMFVVDSRQKFAKLITTSDRLIKINRQHKKNYDILLEKINKSTSSICAYVSNAVSMRNKQDIGKLHQGLFAISKQLNIPIIPIVLDRIQLNSMGVVTNKTFHIGIGKKHIVKSVDKSIEYVRNFFITNLKAFAS